MRTHVVSLVVVALGAMFLGGCTNTESAPGQISGSLSDLKGEVRSGRANVVETTKALKNLRDNRGTDIKPQYDSFVAAMDRLEAKAGGVRGSSETASETASTYFQSWDRQISQIGDEKVASAAKDRRAKVMASYEKLKDRFGSVRNAYRAYDAKLEDVRRSLASDMTAEGSKAARPAMNKAVELEEPLLKQLDQLSSAIDEMTR